VTVDRDRRVDVLGVGISAVNLDTATRRISEWIEHDDHTYVCVTGVHGVMESRRDATLRAVHNASGMTTPDGMPMVWAGRWAGFRDIRRVYGPDLMRTVLQESTARGWSSYFYGGRDGVAERLAATMQAQVPGLTVAGTRTPPFPIGAADPEAEAAVINASGAQIVWVGLSTPTQERWMAANRDRLTAPVLIGVGAAFDLLCGEVRQAPRWIQRSGFEWAYRVGQEPRRLWRRYARNNPAFVAALFRSPPRPL
jgi:N-acetylglucosaminyldiphosphoundecaprenol N-acetyl-beta-D-mannosaminyltransferase